jgi:hypothetical protein
MVSAADPLRMISDSVNKKRNFYHLHCQMTGAAQYEAYIVFARSNTGIVVSNPT